MPVINIAEQLIHFGAAKHFVGLTFRVIPRGQDRASAVRWVCSAFVVDASGIGFLVTAGHVINEIRESINAGNLVEHFALLDMAARGIGTPPPRGFEMGVPIPFESGEWAVFDGDPEGTDYAAWAIPPLILQSLAAGGIEPIGEHAWREPDPSPGATWFLVGAPKELQRAGSGAANTFNITAVPVDKCEPPNSAANRVERRFARLRHPPEGIKPLDDVNGMSGGPIYEVRYTSEALTYWLIGVQSSWFPSSRIIAFSPAAQFLDSLVEAVGKAREKLAQGADGRSAES